MSTATDPNPPKVQYDPDRELMEARVFTVAGAVQDWADAHRNDVRNCFIVYTEGTFEVTVLGTAGSYDFELNRELAELTVGLVRTGIPVVGQLFPSSVSQPLFSTGRVIRIKPS